MPVSKLTYTAHSHHKDYQRLQDRKESEFQHCSPISPLKHKTLFCAFSCIILNGLAFSVLFQRWNRELWDLSSSGEDRYWESQMQALKSFLHHLKVVKIDGFSECENDISLAKFLLKHGKVLQELTLSSRHYNARDSIRRERIKSQMMEFSRASSKAKIAFQ